MYRRRSRIHSTALGIESRWKPSLSALVLAVGVLVGLVVNLPGALNSGAAALDDAYLALAASLHSQGENVAYLRENLRTVGFVNPSTSVITLADKYQDSRDVARQDQSRLLRSFGEAMAIAPAIAITAAPNAAEQRSPPLQRVDQRTKIDVPIMIGTPVIEGSITPLSLVIQQPEFVEPKTGKITASGTAARLRREPNTESDQIALMPDGAQIEIKGLVEGEAVTPVEPRWYHITYNGIEGYVYYTLVAVTE